MRDFPATLQLVPPGGLPEEDIPVPMPSRRSTPAFAIETSFPTKPVGVKTHSVQGRRKSDAREAERTRSAQRHMDRAAWESKAFEILQAKERAKARRDVQRDSIRRGLVWGLAIGSALGGSVVLFFAYLGTRS